ncbi:MAG TPA: single-stranded DNA-binding protein [Fimbriimonas sp.]
MSLNRVVLIGRLTRDPEFRTTPNGKNYAAFGIAVQKRIKPQDPNERDADFFNIKVWGQSAEYVKNYLTKGRLVSIDGRLETRRYTDQQGVQKDIFEIVADNVQGLDRPRDDSGAAPSGNTGYSSGGGAPRPAAPAEDEYDPFADE